MIEAKTIIDNKFWILRENGSKIGILNKVDFSEKYVISYDMENKIIFNNHKKLMEALPIIFTPKIKKEKDNKVFGYFCDSDTIIDPKWDLKRDIPLYLSDEETTSWQAAGYYRIFIPRNGWGTWFCPKQFLLDRYEYHGPFFTEEEANQYEQT